MKTVTAEMVIEEYIQVGKVLQETYKTMDSKRGNREGKKLIQLFKLLENNVELAQNSLPTLLQCDNAIVRTKAAAACISLGIFVQKAKKVLEDVKDVEDNITAFNARMTLKVWREQGYLKVYPTQEIRMVQYPL